MLDSISCEGMTDYENIIRLNEFNRERGGITFLITDGFGENIDKVLDFYAAEERKFYLFKYYPKMK